MPASTLDLTGEETPITTLGHGTGALGSSDSSDSGSDVVGGPGMDEGLSDEQARRMPRSAHGTAGRDMGDAALDSDSDRAGTGERGAAGVQESGANDAATTVMTGSDADEGLDDADATSIDDVAGVAIDAADDDGLDDVPASDGAT